MSRKPSRRRTLYCSECGRGDHETPDGMVMLHFINICADCVKECVAALARRDKAVGKK